MLDLLKRLLTEALVAIFAPKSDPNKARTNEPPWLIAARKEIGFREQPGNWLRAIYQVRACRILGRPMVCHFRQRHAGIIRISWHALGGRPELRAWPELCAPCWPCARLHRDDVAAIESLRVGSCLFLSRRERQGPLSAWRQSIGSGSDPI